MPIQAGQTALADDFINESEKDSSRANDAGKVVKLESDATMSNKFIKSNLGDGSDGDVVISSPTTLTKDMYYNNLTVNDTLTTDGYKIYVKNKLDGTGTITWGTPNNGGTGSTGGGSNGIGGGGASASGSGTLINVGGSSGGGGRSSSGTACDSAYNAGVNGVNSNPCLGFNGVSGGDGGSDGRAIGGSGGSGGTKTSPHTNFPVYSNLVNLMADLKSDFSLTYLLPQAGSGGGGAGGDCNGGAASGSGGGGGASGGVVFISAFEVDGTFSIEAVGGNGGNGSNSSVTATTAIGGGGGGAGGNGGVTVLIYKIKNWTGTYDVSGGTGGSGGLGGNSGAGNGQDGTDGTDGVNYEIQLSDLI